MQSLVICTSAADRVVARDIRRYLETNCPAVALHDDAVVSSADELLDAVDFALSADFVILLLSPDALPSAWTRDQWEPVLLKRPRELGTALAFVLLRPCQFPAVLRKQNFFDLSESSLAGLRRLRQWLIEQNFSKQERFDALPAAAGTPDIALNVSPELESLIVDQPGALYDIPREAALTLAHAHSRGFEGVFWLDCLGRSAAGIIGDTARFLGLRLRGTTARNAESLHEYCAAPRCLFVFDGLPAEHRQLVTFQGSASVIFTAGTAEPPSPLPLAQTVELFSRWRSDPDLCLRHLRDAEQHFRRFDSDPSDERAGGIKNLGASVFSLLRQQERLAEAYEVLRILSRLAWEEGNASDLHRWEWEKSWIQGEWGEPCSARQRLGSPSEPTQLTLEF